MFVPGIIIQLIATKMSMLSSLSIVLNPLRWLHSVTAGFRTLFPSKYNFAYICCGGPYQS